MVKCGLLMRRGAASIPTTQAGPIPARRGVWWPGFAMSPVCLSLLSGSCVQRDARWTVGCSIEPAYARDDVTELVLLLVRPAWILAASSLIVRRLDLGVLGRSYLDEKGLYPSAALAARQGSLLDRSCHRDVFVDQLRIEVTHGRMRFGVGAHGLIGALPPWQLVRREGVLGQPGRLIGVVPIPPRALLEAGHELPMQQGQQRRRCRERVRRCRCAGHDDTHSPDKYHLLYAGHH